jgi:hypothetical protein
MTLKEACDEGDKILINATLGQRVERINQINRALHQ